MNLGGKMGKHLKLALVFLAGIVGLAYAGAGVDKLSNLGPALATLVGWANGEAAVTIAAGSAGVRNCLNNLTVSSNAGLTTVRILDGNTTTYAVDLGTGPLVQAWPDSQMCGSAATAFSIKVSTPANAGPPTTQRVSYSGYTY